MKINSKFTAQLLSTSVTTSKDGRQFYHITIFVPSTGEAGQINVSEDLYKSLVTGQSYDFIGEWNDKYNSFRVVGVDND